MTSLQSKEDCQSNDPNNTFPMEVDSSLKLPLDSSMCVVFTGYFNGVSVEVRSYDEMTLLHHMGCFGKGTASRSRPKTVQSDSPCIMRRRQFLKRNYWFKKFGKTKPSVESDHFFKEVDNLITKILTDSKQKSKKDVINLVSTDEEDVTESVPNETEIDLTDKQNIAVVVPNSDSEGDNYFANMKPKCCINKVELHEKLMLTLQEAFFLMYGLGCLQIINNEDHVLNIDECWGLFNEIDNCFTERYVVYHYFRSKGYIVKPGITFGGDYLLYKEGPGINHAEYIVVINLGQESPNWIALLGHVRMAVTTVKDVLIAEVHKSNKGNLILPQDLSKYTVQESMLSSRFPINNDND